MVTKQAILAKNNKINVLLQEVKVLRSAVIGWVGKDKEGSYKIKFIKQVLKSSKGNNDYIFRDKESFLQSLKS